MVRPRAWRKTGTRAAGRNSSVDEVRWLTPTPSALPPLQNNQSTIKQQSMTPPPNMRTNLLSCSPCWALRCEEAWRGVAAARAGPPVPPLPAPRCRCLTPPVALHARSRGKAFNTHASAWQVRPRSSAFHTYAANEVSKFQSKVSSAGGGSRTPRRTARAGEAALLLKSLLTWTGRTMCSSLALGVHQAEWG